MTSLSQSKLGCLKPTYPCQQFVLRYSEREKNMLESFLLCNPWKMKAKYQGQQRILKSWEFSMSMINNVIEGIQNLCWSYGLKFWFLSLKLSNFIFKKILKGWFSQDFQQYISHIYMPFLVVYILMVLS